MSRSTNWYILFYLLVAVESLTYYAASVAAIEDDMLLLDLINKHIYPDLIQKTITEYLYDSEVENSLNNCSQELVQFWNEIDYETQAAYLDSFGKIGPGILTGNIVYLGYYDECTDIANTDYCRFPFDVTVATNTTNQSITIPFEIGMCFPSSCDANEFYELFFIDPDELFSNMSEVEVSIEYTEPHCPWRDLDWTTSSIIMLTVCILFIALVIMGTMVDILLWPVAVPHPKPSDVKNSTSGEGYQQLADAKPASKVVWPAKTHFIKFLKDLILSFSLYKTVPVIMSTKQPSNAITSINGLRVISMCWVILGHTLAWAGFYNIMENPLEPIETIPERFLYQPLVNGFFAVDNFFILSGLLMSYLSIREIEHRHGKFPIALFYIHRFLRLSPVYFFMIFLKFKVVPYVGSGPVWFLPDYHYCEKYWWTNILYINNFYPATMEQCYNVSWYLAADMQFFIISPIFILLLYNFWEVGLSMIISTMVISTAVIGTLSGIRTPNANVLQGALTDFELSSFNLFNIYVKPHCRINAYLVGIVLGFVLYKKWKLKFNFWVRLSIYILLWMIAVASCVSVIFGQYQTWHGHPFSKSENVMYFMFSRTVYSIGIALIIYACHNGFGGIINSFLSWSFWAPLSRLTFMAYLIHPNVLDVMYGTMRFRFIYTDWILMLLFTATVFQSYSVAFIFAVTVEYPLANVESAVYKIIGMKRRADHKTK